MNDKKFCTGCQCFRDIEGGYVKKANRTSRWVCKNCAEKKTVSIYQSKNPTSKAMLAKVKTMLYGEEK